jgi:hypothetical protein
MLDQHADVARKMSDAESVELVGCEHLDRPPGMTIQLTPDTGAGEVERMASWDRGAGCLLDVRRPSQIYANAAVFAANTAICPTVTRTAATKPKIRCVLMT